MEDRSSLTRRRGVIPILLAALMAVGAIGAFWSTRRALATSSSGDSSEVASAQAALVTANLAADAALLTTTASALGGLPDLGPQMSSIQVSNAAETIGVARLSPAGTAAYETALRSPVPGVDGLRGTDLLGRPVWRLGFDLARDGGRTVVAAASAPDGTPIVLQAVPLYGPGPAPATVADRRRAVLGFVVLVGPASSLLGPPVPRSSVRLLEGSTLLAATGNGTPPASAAGAPVTGVGSDWMIQAWSMARPSRVPDAILIGGLALALVGALVVTLGEAESVRLARAAMIRSKELSLVARIGPLLQKSLELGELLPLFVVEITDELDLDGVAVSLMSDSGRLVRSFSLGTGSGSAPDDPAMMDDPPDAVAPGGVITVPLQRAGRIVGALTARARSGLDSSQTGTLRAVSDLLAAALGNARLLQEEQAMVARLQDLDRLKTTFLGSVSHDLRTSVTAIEGFAGLLAGQGLDDGQRSDFLIRIQRNARSLGVLVEDLLDFARLERSGFAVSVQPVDLSDLIPKVVDQMSSILGGRPVAVMVADGIVALADPGAMERIVINLLSNAAKYTPVGTEVSVTLTREGTDAVLEVSDRGPGISPEERERVFDRFYRIDNEDASLVRGVGIGLALVRQLVELQHGRVAVDDAPGGGARFRVTVPVFTDAVVPARPS